MLQHSSIYASMSILFIMCCYHLSVGQVSCSCNFNCIGSRRCCCYGCCVKAIRGEIYLI